MFAKSRINSTPQAQSAQAFRPAKLVYAGGRPVGSVKDGVFHKTIKPNHYLRKPPAIAFDVQSLKDAEQAGAQWVHVRDAETGVKYKASIAHIWRVGFRFNRGYGDQIALPLEAWILQKPGGGLQLDLWPSAV
jgi:hypothetical protein